MVITIFEGDAGLLRHLGEAWEREHNGQDFGIKTDINVFLSEIARLVNDGLSDVLVMHDKEKIVGLLGITAFQNPIGRGLIASEHFWYVLPDYRGLTSVRMVKAAENWAKNRGCTHLIMNASLLASPLYHRVIELYKVFGMREFETSFIKKLE